MANRLDDVIEIPEVLNFICNDRSELMDQLKVLQMVLRKERDKNGENSSPVASIQFPKKQSVNKKDDLQEKVDKHKNAMAQKRQDKLKQMDAEAEVLSRALNKEEGENSESTKVSKEDF